MAYCKPQLTNMSSRPGRATRPRRNVPVIAQKVDEPLRVLVGKTENHLVAHFLLGSVARDSLQDLEPAGGGVLDRLEIAVLHIGKNAVARGGEVHEVALDVAFGAERE